MKTLAGKTVVVTGAGSGIGRSLAVQLAGKGARLALSDVNLDAVSETVALCGKAGAEAAPFTVDVADRDAVYAHAEDVRSRFGGANVIINNAGVSLSASIVDMTWDDFDWIMGIDFWGVAHGTKAFLPDLIASGDGHVVNVSSVFGLMSIPAQSAYNAAKFAVRGFTGSLRQEMISAGHNVGVTCVHPGGIKTGIVRNGRQSGEFAQDLKVKDDNFQKIAFTRPETAAKKIIKGIEKNKPKVLIGPDARLFDALPRLLGGRYQDVMARPMAAGQRIGQ
ncbi:SDR family NAD(P)-dependent oxidoreductase [Williamsia herbipolensis]|uniref:SDR family NAD(P)-dependent oxidoreductase n=1 Tax=Williamsia herbipolensis TaxID=1603258 RepID=A0AAU4JXX2_9NOCA|nr:SDR family NAD(P)-dependent oxidoreductase [Williamsia herbipolensis]